ncbi:unnamed protein product [Thlaspi arvense]|uniref:Uncharacterized protein n=1 Tax=Thlaspi arvense TaxID=13288 RepID=A0AAU9S5I3_THLAR|nr:unnamed protein product [Thlaspi arvense]
MKEKYLQLFRAGRSIESRRYFSSPPGSSGSNGTKITLDMWLYDIRRAGAFGVGYIIGAVLYGGTASQLEEQRLEDRREIRVTGR